MVAEGLGYIGVSPGDKVIMTDIKNTETLAAFEAGVAASNTLLGRHFTNTLNTLGLTPISMQYQMSGGKLNIIVIVGGKK